MLVLLLPVEITVSTASNIIELCYGSERVFSLQGMKFGDCRAYRITSMNQMRRNEPEDAVNKTTVGNWPRTTVCSARTWMRIVFLSYAIR